MASAWTSWGKVPGSIKGAGSTIKGGIQQYLGSAAHAKGMSWAAGGYGFGKDIASIQSKGWRYFGRGVGFAFLGYEAYAGYQRGGILGAATGVATQAAINYGIGAAWGAIGGTAALGAIGTAAAVAAPIAGAWAYNKYGSQVGRETFMRHARTELGAGVADPFGTVSTMRRRSVSALNSSRLNGQTALGNEAAMSYSPYFR